MLVVFLLLVDRPPPPPLAIRNVSTSYVHEFACNRGGRTLCPSPCFRRLQCLRLFHHRGRQLRGTIWRPRDTRCEGRGGRWRWWRGRHLLLRFGRGQRVLPFRAPPGSIGTTHCSRFWRRTMSVSTAPSAGNWCWLWGAGWSSGRR